MKSLKQSTASRCGLLVTIEGVTSAGKSYFADHLEERLDELGVRTARFGGFLEQRSWAGNNEITTFLARLMEVKRYIDLPWLTETTLLLAEQALNLDRGVIKSVTEGRVVIYENYSHALLAYQFVRAVDIGLPPKQTRSALRALVDLQYVLCGYPRPEMIIYVHAPLKVLFERMAKRNPSAPPTAYDRRFLPNVIKEYDGLLPKRGTVRVNNNGKSDLAQFVQRIADSIVTRLRRKRQRN